MGPTFTAISKQKTDETEPSATATRATQRSDDLDRGHIFEILSNERRRHVIDYLQQRKNGPVDLGTLVTHVAARESRVPPEHVSPDDRKSVYVGLRQTHLPKMDSYNVIEYDPDRGTIEPTETADRVRMYMEYVPENDIPWAYTYVALGVLMTLITGLSWLGVYPFGALDGLVIAAITLFVFGFSAVMHAVYTYRNRFEHGVPKQVRTRP